MGSTQTAILTVNSGSSSIKLVLFSAETLKRILEISVANIGQQNATVTLETASDQKHTQEIQADNHESAIAAMLDRIADQLSPDGLVAIGHRVVHGGQKYGEPIVITAGVVENLKHIAPFDPEHMKTAIGLIDTFQHRFPQTTQVACFDTAFYKDMPLVARLLPLPRKFESLGLRRYGFHGLSYEYLLQQFRELAGETAMNGRVILAHLGSGASLTAVKNGKPLDTTMSFTPASGIPMSTRSGDLDPGIVAFLHERTGMTIEEFNHMVHFESGLLGVSGTSADMEVLIRDSAHSQHAADAVNLFCYQVRKTIGSFAAVLGGLDSLIFAGGMGENAPFIRENVCEGLEYLGIKLDTQRNMDHEFLISGDDSAVGVHVIHTDEAAVIAAQTRQTVERES
jgi:acetate kinase